MCDLIFFRCPCETSELLWSVMVATLAIVILFESPFASVVEGCVIIVGDLVYEPPRDGPTLWEIGIPDHTAAEFYVSDLDPKYLNKLLC